MKPSSYFPNLLLFNSMPGVYLTFMDHLWTGVDSSTKIFERQTAGRIYELTSESNYGHMRRYSLLSNVDIGIYCLFKRLRFWGYGGFFQDEMRVFVGYLLFNQWLCYLYLHCMKMAR